MQGKDNGDDSTARQLWLVQNESLRDSQETVAEPIHITHYTGCSGVLRESVFVLELLSEVALE
jgi:hypothetical protein